MGGLGREIIQARLNWGLLHAPGSAEFDWSWELAVKGEGTISKGG